MIRLFVGADLAAGAPAALRPDQVHYLVHVMRQAEGAEILAFNGRDGEWRATLRQADKRDWRLVASMRTRAFAPSPDLELIAAVVKRPRLETIVEKAAELGARRVRPVLTERTNPAGVNLDRLRSIAVEAAEQTGRLDAPEVDAPERLGAVLAQWPSERRLMFCDEGGDVLPAVQAVSTESPGAWSILIGPEGGFSPAERAAIRAVPGVVPVGLGPRILRADTAAISAMTLWQSTLGDWAEP